MIDDAFPVVSFSSLVFGGTALGRLSGGRALFVPYALPGEKARIRITENRKGYVRGELMELIEASPSRIQPRCRHFTLCGGCHYQHMDEAMQREAKAAIVREQLARLGEVAKPPVREPVPSPAAWYYRNNVQLHRSPEGRLGFKAFRSARIVPIEECHLPEPELLECWQRLEGAGPKNAATVVLRRGTEGEPLAGGGGPGPPEAVLQFTLPGGRFRVSIESFFQVNTPMADLLAREVVRLLETGLPEAGRRATVLDLYCGVGLFSLYAASRVKRILGVELSPGACADYRHNLAGAGNAELHPGSVEEVLPRLGFRPEAAIADPPRAGLGRRVIRALAALGPSLLIYVSCDPATLARDARELAGCGYALQSITPFDLFPQTYHIETVSDWVR